MLSENPHDKFFKEAFSRPDVLVDFMQAYLPDALFTRLDFSTLQRETDSFTDDGLDEHFADLVFTVACNGKPILVTLLLEHKSYVENHPHFQLNRYLLSIWAHQLTEKKPLTPVLPIVVYHGDRPWRKRPLSAYFESIDDVLLPFTPVFDYVLIDLSKVPEAVLPRLHNDYARLTALLLQNSRRKKRLARVMEQYAEVFQNLVETVLGQRFVGTAVIYLSAASSLGKTELIAIFRRVSTKTTDSVMTAYEELISEGLEQGTQRTTLKFIQGLWRLGIDPEIIAKAAEMPVEEVQAIIKNIDEEKNKAGLHRQ